jgi:hypothetical protein
VFTKAHRQTYNDPFECNPLTLAAILSSHVRARHAGRKHLPINHHLTYKTLQRKLLALSNPIFCQPHTPQLLFVLGGKEVRGLLVIILQF